MILYGTLENDKLLTIIIIEHYLMHGMLYLRNIIMHGMLYDAKIG